VIRVSSKPAGLSIISSVTNKRQLGWKIFDGALNSGILIDFLRRLIKGATKKVFLILDNLRVHHSKPVKEWLGWLVRGQEGAADCPIGLSTPRGAAT
jgi:hypothetical protein